MARDSWVFFTGKQDSELVRQTKRMQLEAAKDSELVRQTKRMQLEAAKVRGGEDRLCGARRVGVLHGQAELVRQTKQLHSELFRQTKRRQIEAAKDSELVRQTKRLQIEAAKRGAAAGGGLDGSGACEASGGGRDSLSLTFLLISSPHAQLRALRVAQQQVVEETVLEHVRPLAGEMQHPTPTLCCFSFFPPRLPSIPIQLAHGTAAGGGGDSVGAREARGGGVFGCYLCSHPSLFLFSPLTPLQLRALREAQQQVVEKTALENVRRVVGEMQQLDQQLDGLVRDGGG
ncbi:unnamed protein product [Closterium sp. Yama58-4]|nr:unnamed protein product [Closterium sp. Yama58-4]